MRNLIAFLLVMLFPLIVYAAGAAITLGWTPDGPAAGYKIYMGNYSGSSNYFKFICYTTIRQPSATNATVTVTDTQKWFFRVTAFDSLQESKFSNYVEVYFVRTPLAVKFQKVEIR